MSDGKTQRINVTLDAEDLEIIQILSSKQKVSMSSLIKKMVHEWLEDYEDMLLIQKIEERENEKNPLISHEKYWEIKE
jgi:predicted DNA binding CopG/RHH family protein